ncbi:hypothetical protein B0A89_06775 [Paracoccus contaminans]|uniref:DUF2382 domain-containing protein n=2 Tax=Paracoccus contaminans TaxID=1945662 RepID=A0A1W6D0Y3_9RHOB|nr:hypothetical protein B0A89_06775 [Paracoccus contaminans]
MNTGTFRTLSAMFDTRAEADRAVAALSAAGIADAVLTGGENPGYGSVPRDNRDADKGFFESIGDFFFPEEDRYAYAEGLSRGGYLVTVSNLSDSQYATALDILDDEGAVDLDQREAEWRSEGWSGYDRTATETATRAMDRDTLAAPTMEGDLNNDGTIDVVEERMLVSKREAEAGRVRVRSYVREIPVEQSVELRSERVNIERRPVDRPATGAEFGERTIEAREYVETPVVSKDARVVEEINLNKDVESHVETVRDTVRKTEVEIEDERTGTIRTDRDTDLNNR